MIPLLFILLGCSSTSMKCGSLTSASLHVHVDGEKVVGTTRFDVSDYVPGEADCSARSIFDYSDEPRLVHLEFEGAWATGLTLEADAPTAVPLLAWTAWVQDDETWKTVVWTANTGTATVTDYEEEARLQIAMAVEGCRDDDPELCDMFAVDLDLQKDAGARDYQTMGVRHHVATEADPEGRCINTAPEPEETCNDTP